MASGHPNDTPDKRELAEESTILRALVGSGVHGTSVAGTDDRDELGVCVEPPQYVIGLRKFEQWEHHTAWLRPGGRANRSGPGDLDVTVYSLRKYMSMALKGNPSVLALLFTPEKDIVAVDERYGRQLLAAAPAIASRQAGHRFLGYLHGQRNSMLSHEGKGRDVTRPELVEKYGYDVKFAGHMVRLGFQGIEYVNTGRMTLPMPPAERDVVLGVRTGQLTMKEALDLTVQLEEQLRADLVKSPLPEHPDYDAADAFLINVYENYWADHAGMVL